MFGEVARAVADTRWKKDCVFQYALPREIIKDTGMLTREQGEALWEKYKPIFIEDMLEGREPEMVLWIDMESPTNFHKTARHWIYDDMIVLNGEVYQRLY